MHFKTIGIQQPWPMCVYPRLHDKEGTGQLSSYAFPQRTWSVKASCFSKNRSFGAKNKIQTALFGDDHISMTYGCIMYEVSSSTKPCGFYNGWGIALLKEFGKFFCRAAREPAYCSNFEPQTRSVEYSPDCWHCWLCRERMSLKKHMSRKKTGGCIHDREHALECTGRNDKSC